MMHEPREPRRRLEVVELRSRDGDSCVVAISDGRGGEALLQLDPPYSSPQFLPDIGGDVVLDMSGPVPQVVARQIAVDAISAREARFDLMTALLFYGAKIIAGDPNAGHIELDWDSLRLYRPDGVVTIRLDTATGNALVTGEYRSAESGQRFVINPDGVNPADIRFYPPVGNNYGTIKTTSEAFGNGVADFEIIGPIASDGVRANISLDSLGVSLSNRYAEGQVNTQESYLIADVSQSVLFYKSVNGTGSINIGPYDARFVHSGVTYVAGSTLYVDGASAVHIRFGDEFPVTRIQANATGIGFYGATPVAKPTVTGSRGGNAALASLLTALASQGLITNSSTA